MYQPYDRYEGTSIKKAIVSAPTVREALAKMADNMRLYIDGDDILDEEEYPDIDDIIDRIVDSDGCDYIYLLKNMTDNEVYIQDPYYNDEPEEW